MRADMKFVVVCLLGFTVFLNLSCQQEVISSSISKDEQITKVPEPSPTPNKYEETDIIEQFSTMGDENQPTLVEFQDYKIKKVSVRKKDEIDSPEADIYDAVVSKNGKTIARFEGIYYPLGNEMSFGLYPFLGESEKQLFILEESNRYDREWIVNLSPKYEVIFDAADFDVISGYLRVIDIDNDGQKEITLYKGNNIGYMFPPKDIPLVRIVFKFDEKTRKYLPASHKFPAFTLKDQEEQIKKFNENKTKKFSKALEIMLTYIYAGKEESAWQLFDNEEIDFTPESVLNAKTESKEQLRVKIKNALNKDPIYKFIKTDLKKKN
jgi:hypothetical protein